MASEFETIATNHVPEGWLGKAFSLSDGVTQQVLADGGGIALNTNGADGWVAPWAGVAKPAGDAVGVLLLLYADGLQPAGGSTITGGTVVWLRGSAGLYAHAIAVRANDLSGLRLHAPAGGRTLTVLKCGLYDMDSWQQMQTRDVIYFDGGSMTRASADGYVLPPATSMTLGGVMIDTSTLRITPAGLLSVLRQEIPTATADRLGGVKTGRGVRTAADGTLSVRLGRNLDFDANGAIEAPDIQTPDLSDYVTNTRLEAKLSDYYTKDLADAKFEPKGSGGGSGGDGGGGSGTEDFGKPTKTVKVRFMKIVNGEWDVSFDSAKTGYLDVNYNGAGFVDAPHVTAASSTAEVICQCASPNTTKFSLVAHYSGTGNNTTAHGSWSAIGPVEKEITIDLSQDSIDLTNQMA